MPWVNSVASIVHAWYLGHASGDAIADVIFGKHNPGGKLSLTFPRREEDVTYTLKTVKFDTVKTFMLYVALLPLSLFNCTQTIQGYKHYQHRNLPPLFSFGYVNFLVAPSLPHNLIGLQGMDSRTPPSA